MLAVMRDQDGNVVIRKKPLFFPKVLIWRSNTGITVYDCFSTDYILR